MWVNLFLHNNTERATINRVKKERSFPRLYLTSYDRSRITRASCEMLMHRIQFVTLISWARYARRPSSASWSESVSQLNLSFDLAGRRACGRAAPRSKSTWSTRCFDTRRRILTIPVLPEQEIGQNSHDCMPLRIYHGASKSVNQLAPSYIDQSRDFLNSVKFSIFKQVYMIFNNINYICQHVNVI